MVRLIAEFMNANIWCSSSRLQILSTSTDTEREMEVSSVKLPSGKHTKNDGKSPYLMSRSTINQKLLVYQRVPKIGAVLQNHV